MSYEAWGDDDDGMDGFREHYRKQLIEDGWLDDEAAAALRAERDALAAKLATPPESGGQGEVVATVCLRGNTYGSGNFMELQVQVKPGTVLPIGTKLYTHPPAQGQGWLPIESAPRGKEVLVWRDDSGPFIAKLATPEEVIPDHALGNMVFPDDFEEWFSDAYGWQEGDGKPTHWMPLPAAPAEGAA